MKHPIQPLEKDEHGTLRFKKNAIVEYLLDNGGIDLNKIARLNFSDEDREQFAQLIGYSLYGFSDLSYASEETFATAKAMAEEGETEEQAKIKYLEEKLDSIKKHMRELVPEVFNIHPDDLE